MDIPRSRTIQFEAGGLILVVFAFLIGTPVMSVAQLPLAPQKPLIVLIPGAGSSGPYIYVKNTVSENLKIRYFGGLERVLSQRGLDFLICPLNSTRDEIGLAERAKECASLIGNQRSQTGGKSDRIRNVMIYGHSLGGLVARLLANLETVAPWISSVTTVATPHRGTIMADFILNPTGFKQGSMSSFWKNFFISIGMTEPEKPYLTELQMLRDGKNQRQFAGQDAPENSQVSYYSICSSQETASNSMLRLSQKIIKEELINAGINKDSRHKQQFEIHGTANDGVVPELAMTYGQNLGHIEADHFESTCNDLFEQSLGCRELVKVLIPHLESNYKLLESQIWN